VPNGELVANLALRGDEDKDRSALRTEAIRFDPVFVRKPPKVGKGPERSNRGKEEEPPARGTSKEANATAGPKPPGRGRRTRATEFHKSKPEGERESAIPSASEG